MGTDNAKSMLSYAVLPPRAQDACQNGNSKKNFLKFSASRRLVAIADV